MQSRRDFLKGAGALAAAAALPGAVDALAVHNGAVPGPLVVCWVAHPFVMTDGIWEAVVAEWERRGRVMLQHDDVVKIAWQLP